MGASDVRIRQIMTTEVFTIEWTAQPIGICDLLRWSKIRHVPVIDGNGRLMGLLTERDVLRESLSQGGSEISIGRVMRTDLLTVGPEDPVQMAARLLIELKLGCLPVVQDGQLIGILTNHDLLGIVENSLRELAPA